MPKPINLIVACTENRVIGVGRRLPFHIPEDKAWFYEKTAGTVCILGRICYEIWPSVHADGRQPVVISTQPELVRTATRTKTGAAGGGPAVVGNVADALAAARGLPGEIMVCGGQRIYEETLPLADRLLLTLVHVELDGDVSFPEWRHLGWRETWKRESRDANFRYTFSILDRVR